MSQPLQLPIVAVTVMEDRASIRRSVTVELNAGAHRLTVAGVSPLIVDKSLHARTASEGGKVLDLRVHRRRRRSGERASEEGQRLWQRFEDQREILETQEVEMNRLDELLSHYQTLVGQWSREISTDASSGEGDPARWQSDWEALSQRIEETSQRQGDARRR